VIFLNITGKVCRPGILYQVKMCLNRGKIEHIQIYKELRNWSPAHPHSKKGHHVDKRIPTKSSWLEWPPNYQSFRTHPCATLTLISSQRPQRMKTAVWQVYFLPLVTWVCKTLIQKEKEEW
jgi:hypothetical protein